MIKKYVFLLFLSTIYLTTCNKTEVIYDKLRDIIYYEGKFYISKSFNQSQTKPEEISSKIDIKNEDLITGATFLFYIFMILRKYKFLFSTNSWSWINVRFDCWLFIYR